MKPRVYIETTVVSYLTARPSRDLIVAGHQQITEEWWQRRRSGFELFVSQLVLREARGGDPLAADERLSVLETMSTLEIQPDARDLSRTLIEEGPLPEKAAADGLHISIAAVNGMDYLLTWNLNHIANAEMRPAIERLCRIRGFEPPVLCTPEELMGE